MKRSTSVLLILLALFVAVAASAKPRKPKAKATNEVLEKTTALESEEEERERDRKRPIRRTGKQDYERKNQGRGEETPTASDRAPVTIGKPAPGQLKKASGKVFDVRKLPPARPKQKEKPEREGPPLNPILVGPSGELSRGVATNEVPSPVPTAIAPPPTIVFEGLDRFNWGSGSPPDTNGDAGPTYYMQSVNSSVGIYRKSDGVREAAFTFDTLMSQGNFGNQCDTENFGDPVVLYDTFEDRWILTDFAFTLDGGGNVNPPIAFQCFAVSMSGDPLLGGWNFYSITVSDGLNDYPKFGIWPDGLYMSENLFGYPSGAPFITARARAINKAQMYAGSPTVQVVSFDIAGGDFTIVPSNARLQTGTPPLGRPNYFLSTWQYLNALNVYKFHVDWNNISQSTLTGPDVPIAATSWPTVSPASVPQSGTANLLDSLAIRAMVQNQYTKFGSAESLWVNHTVRRANTTGFAAPRWYQVDVSGGNVNLTIPQATTWDPDGANLMHRWMGSLALDRAGNLALGYSTSNATSFPSIKYAGRLGGDPVNTFSYTEQTLFAGTASQTTSTRWGDYSSMTLDPDGCTFWYTTEYANPASQASNQRWLTKIGSFKYPECTVVGAGGTVSGTVTNVVGGTPIAGATVNFGARTTTTSNTGSYSFTGILAGTYPTISASAPGFPSSSSNTIAVTDGGTTTRNFALGSAPASACPTDTTQADFVAGIPVDVDLNVSPGDVKLANPPTLDAQNASLLNAGFAFTTAWHGQTFTANASGPLVRVDLNLFSLSCSAVTMPNITVAIRAASGDLPSGPDLATETLAGFCNGGSGYYTITFGVPTSVVAGTQYALVWRTTLAGAATSPNPRYVSTVSNGDPYAGGRGASSTDGGATWSGRGAGNNDHGFRIYVDTGYKPSGNQVSSAKDAAPAVDFSPVWQSLAWNATTPVGTTVRFQVAAASDINGPYNYVGPDGTAATFFTTSPASLTQFNGSRFVRYKALLSTASGASTPTLGDVTVCSDTAACVGPDPAITPTPAAVCANSTGNQASGPAGMTNYSWAITNGIITAGLTSQTVTYTAGSTGTVELLLTVTEPGGCVNQGTASITIKPVPATPSPGNTGPYCDNGSGVTIQLNGPTVAGATYAWTGPTGFTSSAQNPTRSGATTADAGVYSLTVTVNGCTSAAGTTTVVINNTPATPTASNGGPYCEGQTIQLSTPTVSGATYSWTGPNGFTSALQNPTRSNALLADAGTYSVTVTVNGCTSAAGTTNVVVNPTPATPAPTNNGPYCDGGAGVVVQLNTPTVSGATYSWTGPNGFTAFQQNPTRAGATPVDAGAYFVTVTVNGCTSAAGSTTVNIYATPATPTASNTGPYCEGQTIQLSTPSVLNATYAWTGPNGFTSSAQNPTRTGATPADAGTYSVTVTVDGCTSAAGTTNVVVNPVPATPAASNTGPFCDTGSGVTVQLSTAFVSGATYSWTGPNGFTSALQNATRAGATPADSGTYSVTVTVNGCTSIAGTTTVSIFATPATPSPTNGGPFCEGGTIQLNTPTVSGATYAWTGPNGFISALQNPTRSGATLADAGTYSVTVTVNGCTSPAGTTNVVVNTVPATPTATNTGPYCAGNTIQLDTPLVSGATYAWTGPNGFTSALQNPTRTGVTVADGGTYSVTVTVNGCTSLAGTTNVVVNATPATPAATNTGPYCPGNTIQLNAPAVAGATYAWTGPGGFTSALQNPTRSGATPAESGTYSVTVTVNGCTSAAGTTNVVVNATPATPAPTNGGPYCPGNTIQLNVPTVAGATYAWTGPGGFTSALQNPTRANASVADSGAYSVIVTVNGCPSAAGSTTVTVNAAPATPTITPGGPTTFCAGGSVTLTSSSATGNQWRLNGNPIGGETNQVYVATAAGDFSVVATNGSGCSTPSAATTVTVNPNPNATITGPASVSATSTGNTASVPNAGAGATYNWSITNGTITAGTGTANITFTAGAAGTLTLNVTVTTSAGCPASSSANITVGLSAVTVSSITPNNGSTLGGTNVTIGGTGFNPGVTVTIGGTAATNVVRVSTTSITAKTAAHVAGVVNVTVTNTDTGAGTLTNGYTYNQQNFDPNGDSVIDPADIFYLINYLFLGGPAPAGVAGMPSGDANGDGLVDPADIFYAVNYLFGSGPAPHLRGPVLAEVSERMSGALTLERAVEREGRWFVPVLLTMDEGSPVPQAVSLRVRFAGNVSDAAMHRGAVPQPIFEISRRTDDAISHLVAFGAQQPLVLDVNRQAVIAEIEVAAPGALRMQLDPELTMLVDRTGSAKATVKNQQLKTRGVVIGFDRRNGK